MYEFIGIFSLNKKIDIKSKLLFNNYSYYENDFVIEENNDFYKIKGYSREKSEEVCRIDENECHILLGEAYGKDEKFGSTYYNVKEISELLTTDEKAINKIKGNFIYIYYKIKEKELKIITSRLSINALYYTINNHCVHVSTNLGEIVKALNRDIKWNYTSIIETQIFYFPFGENTIIENINRLSSGTIMKIKNDKIEKNRYFDYRNLYELEKYTLKKSTSLFIEKFYETVRQITSDNKNYNVALTGGFDSRTIYAILNKIGKIIKGYSFGLKDALNIKIPLEISRKLGINYTPIYLNCEYEENFKYWYEQTALLSDGYLGERANYPYAYKKLREYSGISVNGNWGSEAIRPFQNFNSLVSKLIYDINNSGKKILEFRKFYNEYKKKSLIKEEILNKYSYQIEEHLIDWFKYVEGFPKEKRIHMYLYFENERKFFANEIQTERKYCTNRYPYYDDDIVKLLFKSPFSGVNKTSFKKDFYSIYKSQRIYYEILKRYSPEYLNFTTDHGYPPKALKGISQIFFISFGYLRKQYIYKVKKTSEFNNKYLANELYRKHILEYLNNNSISTILSENYFVNNLNDNLNMTSWELDNLNSLIIWNKLLKN